jgi:hypothetical protein
MRVHLNRNTRRYVIWLILGLSPVLSVFAGSQVEHTDLILSIGELRSLRAQVEDQVRRVKASGRSGSEQYRNAQAAYQKAANLHNYLLDSIVYSLLHGGNNNTQVATSLYGFDRALVGAATSLAATLGPQSSRSAGADRGQAPASDVDTATSAPMLHLLFAGVTLRHRGAPLKGLEQAVKDLYWASWENVE